MYSKNVTNAQLPQGTYDLEWSPNGLMLATAYSDGNVYIWDANGNLLHTLVAHIGGALAVAWDNTSDILATGGFDNTIRIWDVAGGGNQIRILEGHSDPVTLLDWNNDGSILASVGVFSLENFMIWDTSGEITSWSLMATPLIGTINRIRWSPDGSMIAVAVAPNLVGVVDTSDYSVDITFDAHEGEVISVAWYQDQERTEIISGGVDGTIRRWDILNESEIGVLDIVSDRVWDLSYSPDGNQIAGALYNGSIYIWDAISGEIIETISTEAPLKTIAWSPDGESLAYGGSIPTPTIILAP